MDHQASTSGDQSFSKKFTEGDSLQNSDVVLRDIPQKNTILHVAAKLKQVETAKKIISEHPSLLHQANSKEDTPLHVAARIGCLEMAQLLIESANKDQYVEADIKLLRMVNVKKDTALHDAVRNGHFQIVKLLIEEDPHLASLENDDGESALFLAVDREYFEIARHILQVAPSYSYRGRNRMNVMHAAIIRTTKAKDYYRNSLANVFTTFIFALYLIKPSFRKSKRNNELGCTEIDFIEEVRNKCPSTILEADEFEWIPLHYAALVGYVEAVELFLKDNNSLAYRNNGEGMSAIHIAARKGHVGVMKKLIGTCPDASELLDDKDRTVLHVAAEGGNADVVKYILMTPNFDGLINEQDKEGNTPLMLAGFYGHHEVAFLLAGDRRVDKGAVNMKGLAAIDIILSNTEIRLRMKTRLARKLNWTCNLAIASMKGVINTENTKTKKQTYKKAEPVEENNEEQAAQDGKEDPESEKLKDITTFDIIAVTIIASVTFTVGLNMPGGYEDNGFANLNNNNYFLLFVIFDALAFFSSASAIFIHFFVAPLDRKHRSFIRLIGTARHLTYWSLMTMIAAFVAGTMNVLKSEFQWAILIALSVLVVVCNTMEK